MPDIAAVIQSGAANPWLYLPLAILLGALHALEPGHSKSMMAAFIIAVRGTPQQGVLLGVAAAIGHTIVVWGLAAAGLALGDRLIGERAEPWLLLISGLLVVLLALRLLSIAWRVARPTHDHHAQVHDHEHGHEHEHGHKHGHDHRRHDHADLDEDAHAAAHAREIEQRFAGRRHVTTGEILWFGFTGGLLPCPAAIAVLLVCLQLREFTLGLGMVAAFSVGLAATLSLVGVVAAWGANAAAQRFSGFSAWSKRLPLLSGALVLALGLFMTLRGAMAVAGAA